MNPQLSTVVDGKKFMWDGLVYNSRDEAHAARDAYQQNRFEVHVLEEGGGFYVYTRRVVEQTVPAAS